MLKPWKHEAFTTKWEQQRMRAAIPGALALGIAVLIGLALHNPAAGMIMAGGALSVGFGAFQTLGRSRTAPMFAAAIGTALSAFMGSLLAETSAGAVGALALAGFLCGLLSALGPGAGWIGLQCAIAAIIASGFPGGVVTSGERALLILAGGVLQTIVVLVSRRVHVWFANPMKEDPYTGAGAALRLLRENLRWSSEAFRHGVHLAITLAVAYGCERIFALSNGYWVPMTALLVLKPSAHQTFGRGVGRVLGTLFGAGLATFLASLLHPHALALAGFVVLFAWLCYSLLEVNYGLFSACITAYIAFLLAFTGQPTSHIALHRLANTALGGSLALLAYVPGFLHGRFVPKPIAPAESEGPAAG